MPQRRREIRIVQRARETCGDRARIACVEQRIGIADQLADAGVVAADHRRAAGHRLDDRKTETLVPGREDEGVAKPVEVHEVRLGDVAGQHDAIAFESDAGGVAQVLDAPVRLHRADDHELHVVARSRIEQSERLDRATEILAMVVAAGVENETAGDAEPPAQGRFTARLDPARGEMGVDASPDGADRIGLDAEEVDGVLPGRFGDGKQQITLSQQPELRLVPGLERGVGEVVVRKP